MRQRKTTVKGQRLKGKGFFGRQMAVRLRTEV
jgi:hypothetical protein